MIERYFVVHLHDDLSMEKTHVSSHSPAVWWSQWPEAPGNMEWTSQWERKHEENHVMVKFRADENLLTALFLFWVI